MSDFMQKQVTGKQAWVKVDTSQGITFLPVGELSLWVRDSSKLTASHEPDREQFEATKKKLWQYTEGEPEDWETIQGFGARLSAPGYLDCTEWAVFDTEQEAREYLEEMYGEEETPETAEE